MTKKGRRPRRTQAERRSETQTAILAASMQILIDDGYARFSASRVASRAGVSRGAQEHYFPKKKDLIVAATRHVMSEAVEHARQLAITPTLPDDPIEKFLLDCERFFFRPIFRAISEIMIAARSDRALAKVIHPIVKDARLALDDIWIDTLDSAGYRRANSQQFIEISQHLLRGLFFADTWLPYKTDRTAVLVAWRQLALTLLQGKTRVRRGRPAP